MGLGTVLSQKINGEEHSIVYVSRKLTLHYATVEQEALAIKWATEELKYYLTGCHFTLITDHARYNG